MRRLIGLRSRAKAPTRRSKFAERPARRRATPSWVRGALWCGVGVLILASASASAAWLWSSGRVSAALDGARIALVDATVTAGFKVREIRVAGRHRVSRAAVIEAVAVGIGEPLVTIDPPAVRRRIMALGWVREATVERRFPDIVLVRIEERSPLALWQRDAKLLVVDRDGDIVGGAAPKDFARLPIIVGDDAPAHAANLLTVVAAQPILSSRVRSAVRVGGRRWNVRLDNGIDVRLPENGVAEAWRRLAEFERRHGLLDRGITAVDLRLPDRLVVRRAPAERSDEGRRT
jgi:cell division protein FtsQ